MMKKLVLLLAVCLALAACAPSGGSEPPPAVPAATAEPTPAPTPDIILERAARLLGVFYAEFNVDTERTAADAMLRVRCVRETFREIGSLLVSSPHEAVEMRSIEGELRSMTLQSGPQQVVFELFSGGADSSAPERTVLWLQVGEETRQYLYEAGVFDTIEALLDGHTVPRTAALKGGYLSLDEKAAPAPADPGTVRWRALQFGGRLLVYGGTFELFDLTTGQSLYTLAAPNGRVDRVEKCDYQGYDYRVVTESGIFYRNSGDPQAESYWALPDGVAQKIPAGRRDAFDADLAAGVTAYATDAGIEVVAPASAVEPLALPNSLLRGYRPEVDGGQRALVQALPLPGGEGAADSGMAFQEPRLLEGGRYLCASIEWPGSQGGFGGVAAMDLSSGARAAFSAADLLTARPVYTPGFAALLGMQSVDRFALGTLSLGGGSSWGTGEERYLSPDLEGCLRVQRGRSPDGAPVATYLSEEGEVLVTATGGTCQVLDMTEEVAVLRLQDAQGERLAVLRYREARP